MTNKPQDARPRGRIAKRAAFYSQQRALRPISKSEWISAAKQIYLDAGDSVALAVESARYLCAEEDWLSGEIQDPRAAARDDIKGRLS